MDRADEYADSLTLDGALRLAAADAGHYLTTMSGRGVDRCCCGVLERLTDHIRYEGASELAEQIGVSRAAGRTLLLSVDEGVPASGVLAAVAAALEQTHTSPAGFIPAPWTRRSVMSEGGS